MSFHVPSERSTSLNGWYLGLSNDAQRYPHAVELLRFCSRTSIVLADGGSRAQSRPTAQKDGASLRIRRLVFTFIRPGLSRLTMLTRRSARLDSYGCSF